MLISEAEALIFDLDGTVADTMPLHYRASQDVCIPLGFDFPLDFFYEQAGRPTVDVFKDLMIKLGNGLDGEAIALKKEERFLEILPSVKTIPYTWKIIEEFKEKKPMAIGSGGQRKAVIKTLEALNIMDLFDTIVSADDVEKHKPHPDTFLKCAESLNIPPERCIVFEDGPPGIVAAKAAGMHVIDVRPYLIS